MLRGRKDRSKDVEILPRASIEPLGSFSVRVDGETLRIPYRIYNECPPTAVIAALPEMQQAVLHSLYTRHHDGFVRQQRLERAIDSPLQWVIPFVVALIGEYVIEILVVIRDRVDFGTPGSAERSRYGHFVAENPEYFETIARRVTSYWNCYYRFEFPVAHPTDDRFPLYPGFALIDALRATAAALPTIET